MTTPPPTALRAAPADLLRAAWTGVAALLAVAAPMLLAYNTSPSSTFLNQALACGGWGLFLWTLATLPGGIGLAPREGMRRLWPALLPVGLVALAALSSTVFGGLPGSLGASALALLACTALALWVGASLTHAGRLAAVMPVWCVALVVAGVLSSLVSLVQVFAPGWADGVWVAATSLPGRASGNLRQPNHLSTLVLWSLVALAWVQSARRDLSVFTAPLALLMVGAVALSASRTGLVGVCLLGLWGLADRRMPARSRWLLVAMPLMYGVVWYALTHFGTSLEHPFGGAARFTTDGDISSSRFAIWSDTLGLITRHPWFGVGFGEFNRAWSLTPFPHRPLAFFDHTHNLPLQFAVELGLPLAALLVGVLAWALWRAHTAAGRAAADDVVGLRCAFMVVLLVAVHSQLEYPLWYAYFLLPTAFALGLCLGAGPPAAPAPTASPLRSWILQVCGAALVAGSVQAVVDYWKVVVIFSPGAGAAPLAERIEAGQRSVYFAHHAHYAAATVAPRPSTAMPSFQAASHYLLDTRLMLAWAKAYAEAGDLDRARHLADRLREFRNAASVPFFEACAEPPPAEEPPPFQCRPAERAMDDRDFR